MTVRIFVGDCREVLRTLPAESVHVTVTSPPYWGLRDYGTEPLVWGGDEADCEHEWGSEYRSTYRNRQGAEGGLHEGRAVNKLADGITLHPSQGQFCRLCSAWRGSLGLEPTPELYVEHLVEVFREVRRVMRSDASLWLNMGSSYKDKQELGIPWRVAFALQQDGWWLRSAIPWIKKNPMPESVTDRPTTAHEYWFLLTKAKRYYWDADAVRKPLSIVSLEQIEYARKHIFTGDGRSKLAPERGDGDSHVGAGGKHARAARGTGMNPAGRNRRTSDFFNESLDVLIEEQRAYLLHLEDVRDNGGMLLDEDGDPLALLFATKPFSGAHFAVFSDKLITPLILAGTSERGCCPECGAGWKRVTDKTRTFESGSGKAGNLPIGKHGPGLQGGGATLDVRRGPVIHSTTVGWRPTCTCAGTIPLPRIPRQDKDESDEDYEARITPVKAGRRRLLKLWEPLPTVPCTALDPFAGAGTVGLVVSKLNRDAILVELSPTYAKMSQERIERELGTMFTQVTVEAGEGT